MPEIVVQDLSHVLVDGELIGRFTDLQWNCGPQLEGGASLLFNAVQAWVDERDRLHAEALAAAIQAGNDAVAAALVDRDATHSADLERVRSRYEKELTFAHASIAPLQAAIADQAAQIEALGGTELGQRLAKEAKVRAAQEAAAKANAELEALIHG